MDARTALTDLGGVASWPELQGLVTRKAVRAALADGVIVKLRRGTYALCGTDDGLAAAARLGGVLSHLSAAHAHGWKVARPPQQHHVTVGKNRSRLTAPGGVTVHWGDVGKQTGVTDHVRTVVDCARTLPFPEALAVADSALRARAVTREQLMSAVEASPRTGRARALRVMRAADARAANPFESVLRAHALEVTGLCVVPQGEIEDWLHPDLVDFRLRIAIEADSWSYHSLREAFEYDIRRYTGLVRDGWVVLRFTWDDVLQKPAYVKAVLRDVVAQREELLRLRALAS